MKLEGFEYNPPVPPGPLYADAFEAYTDLSLTEEGFATVYGFGLSTMQDHVHLDPSVMEEETLLELESEANPVDKYYESLSTADQSAYDDSLYGSSIDDIGCLGQSNPSEYEVDIVQLFEMQEAIQNAKLNVSLDVRTIRHYEEWARCMINNGHPYTSPLDAFLALEGELIEVLDGNGFSDDSLAEFRAREVEIGTATVACGGEVRNLLPSALSEVWLDYADF
jgi:hypothetical protein